MIKNNLVFFVFANAAGSGVAQPGLSGGDRIAIECIRRWVARGYKVNLSLTMSGLAMFGRYLEKNELKNINIAATFPIMFSKRPSLIESIKYEISLLFSILSSMPVFEDSSKKSVIYSSSDFWSDVLLALKMKLKNKKMMWIAGFYIFVPNPFSSNFPYTGIQRMRGLLYYLSQIVTYRVIRKYADMVWVTNELDRWKFIDDKKLTFDKVLAVRGGVDIKEASYVKEPKEKIFDAVFIGRFHPQKGVLELIDIWRYVCMKKPDAKLAIIGEGYMERELRKKIGVYGLQSNITLFGFKDGMEKIRIFKNSRIVVHPAIYDSGGMAPCEAMACGLPGVSFDLPALRTYYPKGMLKTPCYDLKAFADNILNLLEHKELYENMRKDALDWAKEWDWDNRANELLIAIEKLF